MNNSENAPDAPDLIDARIATPSDLAGSNYDEMIRCAEAAMTFLSSPNDRVRLAAILVCQEKWRAVSEHRVIEACQSIADSTASDSIRIASLQILGSVLTATKDPLASTLIARMVLDSQNSSELRLSAYYVLREIHYGIADADFDSFLRATIHTVKSALKAHPSRFSEEAVRSALVPSTHFDASFWNSVDQIDWEFVRSI